VVAPWTVDPVWRFVKNVIGRLQLVKNPILQVIGVTAVSAINTIQWVGYDTWLTQTVKVKDMV